MQSPRPANAADAAPAILHIDTSPDFGGAERSLAELLPRLAERRAAVAAFVASPTLAERLRADGVPATLVDFRALRRSPAYPLRLRRDLAILRAAIPELPAPPTHVVANTLQAAVLLALLPRPLAPRKLWHCRDARRPPLLDRLVLPRIDRILAISQTVARTFPATADVVTVGNAATLSTAACGSVPDTATPAQAVPRRVVMVADWVAWKRHDRFLRLAAALHEVRPDLEFILYGGPRLGARPPRCLRALPPFVRDCGSVPDIAPALRAASLLVHPADDEPFGRVVCEALLAHCPVLAQDSGEPPRICAGQPLARVCDIDDLSAAVPLALELLDLPASTPVAPLPTPSDIAGNVLESIRAVQ